ncbi:MAG: glycerate kinase [Chloroflexota bacterium]|nr:glycerate kinase [Chloroflexota bacterium]
MTNSLRTSPHGEAITRILAAAINAVDPSAAVIRNMRSRGQKLIIGEQSYDLNEYQRILIFGFGKASVPMMDATANILGDKLTTGIAITKSAAGSAYINEAFHRRADGTKYNKFTTGIAVTKSAAGSDYIASDEAFHRSTPGMLREADGTRYHHAQITIMPASHPVPDERGVQAAKRIIEILQTTTPADLVIFLISGGGSALLTAPVPAISLNDLQSLTSSLLACGAEIAEINTLRKHLSQVKGGHLTRHAHPAKTVCLILSDVIPNVIGDRLDVIASGPTVPDPSTYADAIEIIAKYSLTPKIPASILAHLRRGAAGDIPETPKADDPVFERVQNIIVGNNLQAAQAAAAQARKENFNAILLTTRIKGEANQVGPFLAAIGHQIASSGDPIPRPACVIAGGETTVTLAAQHSGLGGRNQEVALSAVNELAGLPNVMLITLATDGDDGPTDAAGAVVTGQTLERAQALGLLPNDFLARNDSYHFFEQLGDLLQPGPTQTNVNDLNFIFVFG